MSGAHVLASVLATLTGAIAASYLGVAGTLLGAGLGSIASTVGTEVYRHYLLRSQERLRSAGGVRQWSARRPAAGNTAHQFTVTGHRPRTNASPDGAETEIIPAVQGQDSSGNGQAGRGGTAGDRAGGDVAEGQPANGRSGSNGSWWRGISRRRWLTYGGVALGFFLVVVAGITVFEVSLGKPLDAALWGRHSTGTSVGNAVRGHSSQQKVTGHPTSTPSAQPATSSTPTPTPSPSVRSSVSATPSPSGSSSGSAAPAPAGPTP